MTNRDVAHSFFYDPYGYKNPSRSSVWYNNGAFYSYSTAICRIFTRNDGQNVALFSENSFSVTTAKHRGYIIQACPFDRLYTLAARRNGNMDPFTLVQTVQDELNGLKNINFNRKENREKFLSYFNNLNDFLTLKEFSKFKKELKTAIRKHSKIADALQNKAEYKALSAKIAEKERKQKEKEKKALQKELSALTKGKSLLEIAKTAYSYGRLIDYKIKDKLKKLVNPKNDLSFIWSDGDKIKTSQQITVELKDAVILLKAWKAGKLKHGMTIDRYTVLNVADDFIKIGCHKIPAENLSELCRELNI